MLTGPLASHLTPHRPCPPTPRRIHGLCDPLPHWASEQSWACPHCLPGASTVQAGTRVAALRGMGTGQEGSRDRHGH